MIEGIPIDNSEVVEPESVAPEDTEKTKESPAPTKRGRPRGSLGKKKTDEAPTPKAKPKNKN